ncbi:hypothetical protein SGRA_3685 [Saprospira grandis str. Lewin]|uniref:Uncharacterized protein n=1 Tax=Saprospira grandis (strain Lewin) TaxID=984262 RepID=H6L6X6_SAPGL|nr:hypothetical protein SGRA_3685 [Saprospira grandis str. Lewin]
MCSSAAKPQTKQKTCFFVQGRANSELRNVAPAEGGRPQKTSIKKRRASQIIGSPSVIF